MKRLVITLFAAASIAGLAGCENVPFSKQTQGAAVGAAAGGLAGHAIGGGALGTIGGAVVGGAVGSEVGRRQEGR
jgi:osmotically inducible lipoprotein OsmB